MTASTLQALTARVERLEQAKKRAADQDDDDVRRARMAAEQMGIYSSVWKWVPEDYYDWALEQRAEFLQAPSTTVLCKSLLVENKKYQPQATATKTNPRYALVVLQYTATLDHDALTTAVRALSPATARPDASAFDWRLADDNGVTGYRRNAVVPIGLAKEDEILLVVAEAVTKLNRIFMGGGHERLKLGVAVSEFCRTTGATTAPVSQVRTVGAADKVASIKPTKTTAPAVTKEVIPIVVEPCPSDELADARGSCEKKLDTESIVTPPPVLVEESPTADIEKTEDQGDATVSPSGATMTNTTEEATPEAIEQEIAASPRQATATIVQIDDGPKVPSVSKKNDLQAQLRRRREAAEKGVDLGGTLSSPGKTQAKPKLMEWQKKVLSPRKVVKTPPVSPRKAHDAGVSPEMQVILARQRMKSNSTKTSAASPRRVTAPVLVNPEVEAAMARRREKSDATKASAAILETDRSKEADELKGFGMNDEVRARMERRRQQQEAGIDVSESVDDPTKIKEEKRSFEMNDEVKARMERRRQEQEAGIDISASVDDPTKIKEEKRSFDMNDEVKARMERQRIKAAQREEMNVVEVVPNAALPAGSQHSAASEGAVERMEI